MQNCDYNLDTLTVHVRIQSERCAAWDELHFIICPECRNAFLNSKLFYIHQTFGNCFFPAMENPFGKTLPPDANSEQGHAFLETQMSAQEKEEVAYFAFFQ